MIRVERLTKTFGEHTAVNNLSVEVNKGETFALLGPNGSGKTTTLKCLAGLIRPSSGKILINDYDVGKNPQQARNQMSYLPQRVNFPDNLTAREVLEFYRRLRKLPQRRVDDIGCMANYVADKKVGDSIAAFYAADFDSKQWLKAEEAIFVASSNFHTPMGGGMVAFKHRTRAEAAAAANQGRQISFAEALAERKK